MTDEGRTIALVGGGRWGRVHASNLARLLTPRDRVLWVSQHNRDALADQIEQLGRHHGPRFDVVSDLDAALAARPSAALVVTAPNTHFSVAELILRRGISTFIEKPLALNVADADSLIELARDNDCILAVGLHLLSASYLKNFSALIAGRAIVRVDVRWLDPLMEVRYGVAKRADPSTPLAHDIYPHIWSSVRVLTGCTTQVIKNVTLADNTALLQSQAGDVGVVASVGRRAQSRVRQIDVVLKDGGTASLDFTSEPGLPFLDGIAHEPDPSWGVSPTPLLAEVQAFLGHVDALYRGQDWPHLAANCLDSVRGAETVAARIERCQLTELWGRFEAGSATIEDHEARALVAGLLSPLAAQFGFRIEALSDDDRRRVLQQAIQLFARFAGSKPAGDGRDEDALLALTDMARTLASEIAARSIAI